MSTYTTHTTPPLVLAWEGNQVTLHGTLAGDPTKVLYPLEGQTYNDIEAKKAYDEVVEIYEQRRREEA